uniref:Uncharacterized protein n=1 Tax=Arundo donax TaxID=35708 RepID=A0A0A9B0P5_ARUDO
MRHHDSYPNPVNETLPTNNHNIEWRGITHVFSINHIPDRSLTEPILTTFPTKKISNQPLKGTKNSRFPYLTWHRTLTQQWPIHEPALTQQWPIHEHN